jgi:DNA-binding transcriptional LysR family regulator
MYAVVPKNHPLANRKSVTLAELAQYPYILLEEGSYSEPLAAFENLGINPEIRYTLHDDYVIMRMVEEGLGVSILAELVLRKTSYDIVCIPIDSPIKRTLAVVYKNWDSLPIASKRFISYIVSNAETLP